MSKINENLRTYIAEIDKDITLVQETRATNNYQGKQLKESIQEELFFVNEQLEAYTTLFQNEKNTIKKLRNEKAPNKDKINNNIKTIEQIITKKGEKIITKIKLEELYNNILIENLKSQEEK